MKKIFSMLALGALMVASSCSNFVDGLDESPNNPSGVTNGLLLSASQLGTFTAFTGQLARLTSVLTQHSAGTDFQLEDIANYVILEGNNVNEWETIYTKCIVNENQLIEQAGETDPYYRGIAKIMKAMALGLATDLWGDVPSQEASLGINGEDNFNPAYDAQAAVIQDVQTLLDEGIADLSKDVTANVNLPGADDFIHGGDVDAWIKTAWLLKARYANRISKRDSESAAKVLQYLANAGMTGVEDDAMAIFGPNGNENNQWYAFHQNRGGYMMMGEFFIEMLKAQNDPRLPMIATQTTAGEYVGTPLGSVDNSTSITGPYYASPTSAAPLATYVEAKFLEAEASLRSGDVDNAASAFNEAVITHIEKVTGEEAPSEFVDAIASEDGASITLKKIMEQKYVAMFTQIESYSDWRRTGFPELTPNPGGSVAGIPRRLPTPSVERLYNTSAVVTSDILKPVWWDE
ncbi:SusD/RagB family nutrient-binding outer membrane lipoprotein [Pontibacter sp. G13]|uniref:SusD/RagB family nutrient-binding outer membrane lipoprotein n=1 Tax=Pontibacter sp. G13 TaxID=3074898 RepID=UPI00288C158A|nr:SusD/RagB family nutrient-binding outer membrane lipoprotein [Pontibacter sp. G13]WNJ20515.1 SusD/RagB family nutrient-binding outer membrane lipoprotein [Pontibacter sp. G13]